MANLSQVGIAGIGIGILHPKQKNKWRAIFVGLGGSLGGTAGVPNDLSLQVITATRPNLSFEEVQLDRYNSRVYILGKHTFEPMTMTVEDDITNRASSAIQNQIEIQQRLIGATGPWWNSDATALSYKFGVKLEMLDGNEGVTEQWMYEGCSIQAVDYGDVDYATGEKMQISLTVRYDLARQVLVGSVTGSAIGGLVIG
jgi:hypothetical protein